MLLIVCFLFLFEGGPVSVRAHACLVILVRLQIPRNRTSLRKNENELKRVTWCPETLSSY